MRNNLNNIYDGEQPQKHVKKSKANGMPRSKHKHVYETVLLEREFDKFERKCYTSTKVCMICGYIGKDDNDPSYYIDEQRNILWIQQGNLSEKAFNLPKWYAKDWSKFAVKVE